MTLYINALRILGIDKVEMAAHCVDHVFPAVPVRQWVLSVPKRIRYYLHNDNQVAGKVLHIFIDVLTQTYRKMLGLGKNARLGGIAFPQRFGDSINTHLHYLCGAPHK